jgi:2-methylisocitrate lyase-like PEP mutase family enzyme
MLILRTLIKHYIQHIQPTEYKMTNQLEHAHLLRNLHTKGSPLVLFNVWDAGSALEALKVGFKVIGTSSWSVAAAHGYDDGQKLPFELFLANIDRIVRVVNVPVTVDAEAGYGQTPTEVQETVAKIAKAGAVGINLEDQIIGTDALYSCDDQCKRIQAARRSASIPLFINARTDIFLKTASENHTEQLLEEALFRASAYAKSGADGLFTPGLVDEKLIKKLCDLSPIPINIMRTQNGPIPQSLAELGVSRISYGPIPYFEAIERFKTGAQNALKMSKNI